MKIVKCFVMFFILALVPLSFTLKSAVPSQETSCSQVATIIFSQHLAKADIPAASKAQLQQILNNLYLGYLVRQNGSEVFTRSGTDQKTIDSYWQALKSGSANYDTNPFCMYTALKQSPKEIQESKICIDTASLQAQPVSVPNCQQNLKNMYEASASYQLILQGLLSQLDVKAFKPTAGADGQYQTNYATFHLQKAVARLAATSSMVCSGMNCTPKFTGDVRDRGIIVNIQNNTQKDFAIVQSTVDGQQAEQIGMLKPGLNNVNLHLASLQAANATAENPSAYKFDVVAIGSNLTGEDQFSIKIMSGTELLEFLTSINKNPKGLFYMNGRLIAPKYAVYQEGQFLVLVKVPKNQTDEVEGFSKIADQDFPVEQRIQVIALNNENPYLLTMQINEDDVEYEVDKDKKTKEKKKILQPSFFSMQSLPGLAFPSSKIQPKNSQPKAKGLNKVAKLNLNNSLSPIILPDFLSNNINLSIYTTMLQTAYIAALTDFAFFNQKCFASDMMCYNLLGYFDKKTQQRIVLNFYSLYLTQKEMLQISEIIEGAIFETNIKNCLDIPMLYVAQGTSGNLVSNEIESIYFNLEIELNDDKKFSSLIENKAFSMSYGIPFQNSLFLRLPIQKVSENTFVYVKQNILGEYEFIFKDKNDELLFQNKIYPRNKIEDIKIDFLDGNKNWIGSKIPLELINQKTEYFCRFKVNYTYDSSSKQYLLHTSAITPIDKIKVVHPVEFFEYPITEMYLDLFNMYEISTIYHCMVTQNGILPSFLQSLSQEDWARGIYMVTEVKDNDKLSLQNPGALTITFYQIDGVTKLGQIVLQGKSDAADKIGIFGPVHAYNLNGKPFVEQFNMFLSTCLLLKYIKR